MGWVKHVPVNGSLACAHFSRPHWRDVGKGSLWKCDSCGVVFQRDIFWEKASKLTLLWYKIKEHWIVFLDGIR